MISMSTSSMVKLFQRQKLEQKQSVSCRLLLKLKSRSIKTNIFRNVKKACRKSFYANDFLTAHRSKLLYDLRKLRGPPEDSKFFISVRNGIPYAVIKPKNEWVQILNDNHLHDLQKMINYS